MKMLVNIKILKVQSIFKLQAVRPAKGLDHFSAMQCLMSLQNGSAGLRHGHGPSGPDRRPDSAGLWAPAANFTTEAPTDAAALWNPSVWLAGRARGGERATGPEDERGREGESSARAAETESVCFWEP